ncbi:MAG: threonylcarbamoyl-AMP synthase [Rickettsiales bacterium]|nr:threonylcarbamoyl-AMP synthase [Rickettsiales bacterium]|tara:strand:- start:13704 stop:14624 length:921 start_codon:yes stop_codon:yes gene_type:complete
MHKQFIHKAAQLLLNSQVIAFPTETVYGLGARADSAEAVKKIFELKGRPSHNPLIAHVPSVKQAQEFAQFNNAALQLANTFWPGPLTLVLPLTDPSKITDSARAGLPTVAVRCPSHPITQELLKEVNIPIVAPSANVSNRISPTCSDHVRQYFPSIPILEGDQSQMGLESTIIDTTSDMPTLLRPGTLSIEQIEQTTGLKMNTHAKTKNITAPGQLDLHYAPTVPLRINVSSKIADEILIGFGDMVCDYNLSPKECLIEASHNLYSLLLKVEKIGKPIAICPIPNIGAGIAINDRLKRAANITRVS